MKKISSSCCNQLRRHGCYKKFIEEQKQIKEEEEAEQGEGETEGVENGEAVDDEKDEKAEDLDDVLNGIVIGGEGEDIAIDDEEEDNASGGEEEDEELDDDDFELSDGQHEMLVDMFKEYGDNCATSGNSLSRTALKAILPHNMSENEWDKFLESMNNISVQENRSPSPYHSNDQPSTSENNSNIRRPKFSVRPSARSPKSNVGPVKRERSASGPFVVSEANPQKKARGLKPGSGSGPKSVRKSNKKMVSTTKRAATDETPNEETSNEETAKKKRRETTPLVSTRLLRSQVPKNELLMKTKKR